ncbi:MAG: BrnA antitoxin family protein [Thermodesulfobacteriota bacterium]|nr:BrnA antitoxin family protein [Thermodesulfobacteriota bacterium]
MNANNSKKKSKTDWDKLNSMSDSDINYSDIPELGNSFFKSGKLRMPKAKLRISIRLDADVLEWFKSHGNGYQTRINAVLRMYMEAHRQNNSINSDL